MTTTRRAAVAITLALAIVSAACGSTVQQQAGGVRADAGLDVAGDDSALEQAATDGGLSSKS